MARATSEVTIRSSVPGAGRTIRQPLSRSSTRASKLGRAAPVESTLAQPVPELGFGSPVETPEPEIIPDALRLLPLGRRTAGAVEEQHRRQFESDGTDD